MDGHYETQVKSTEGAMITVAEVFELVEENLGLEKLQTNPFDMFLYLDGMSHRIQQIRDLVNRHWIRDAHCRCHCNPTLA